MSFKLRDLVPFAVVPRPTRAQRGCFDKVRHRSIGAAEAAIRASLRRDDTCRDGDHLVAYQCRRCLGWHVGHNKENGHGRNRHRDR